MEKEPYYKILDYLDERVKIDSDISDEDLLEFKKQIRDNKYVSTYIRAFKEQLIGYKSIDDFIRMMDKHDETKSIEDVVPYMIRDILNAPFSYHSMQNDPIKLLNDIIFQALEREGKICDFKDSVNPGTKFGRCEGEEHAEMVEEHSLEEFGLTEDEIKEYNKICEEHDEGSDAAMEKFSSKFWPEEELELTLFQDVDIQKFDDNETQYICQKCMKRIREYGDCEVSCDMS